VKDIDEEEDEEKPPLAGWASMVPPATLSTKTGRQRFVATIKLPEKSLKTASSFVKEMNDALKITIDATPGCELTAQFLLVDTERTRLQRATASFSTFKEAEACLTFLKELGLPVNEISAEFEDFGKKKFDPWYESNSQAWWPWFAALLNPPPEMPVMKVTNRLDVTEGSKYKTGASGKLGKSDEVDRADAQADAPVDEDEITGKKRSKDQASKDEGQDERKPRRKKKRIDEGERRESDE
jgi:hypothetical protein